MSEDKIKEGLAVLRKQFEPHQIGKLPKPTKAQTDEVKSNFQKGARCKICGGWHHPGVVHLDYVGHAAITDRLLEVDPAWFWEPLALNAEGLPATDKSGGLWIKLTILGVTRLGYGDAAGKNGGDAVKEIIGDALRNAAMRFGCALDLWHKGELHIAKDAEQESINVEPQKEEKKPIEDARLSHAIAKINSGEYSLERLHGSFTLTAEQLNMVKENVKNDPV
jgi:hypothetical protein